MDKMLEIHLTAQAAAGEAARLKRLMLELTDEERGEAWTEAEIMSEGALRNLHGLQLWAQIESLTRD